MADTIVNRVALSKLMVLDLEDYYVDGPRHIFDLKDWLYEGLVLREKDFREGLNNHDWEQYRDSFVAITCSTDAIIPIWAYALVSTYLNPIAKLVIEGDEESLETAIYNPLISNMDMEPYRDKPVIVKGCSHKPVPKNAYLQIVNKLQSVAKSIMYGEACSSVPLYKRKNVPN
ncbi:DUF2480 family protein [Aegicerativicinus sediminis]|uniref:DUF2480 family protein n=1 Tax=Aegicerativicinus sediminis TaxID=2893202 RepID=UPI001E2C1798|nr:DUF2480 family protein [Aegicerativicinus sediminis]